MAFNTSFTLQKKTWTSQNVVTSQPPTITSFQVRFISFSANFHGEPCSTSTVYYSRRFHQTKNPRDVSLWILLPNECMHADHSISCSVSLRPPDYQFGPSGCTLCNENSEVIENPSMRTGKNTKMNKIKHLTLR